MANYFRSIFDSKPSSRASTTKVTAHKDTFNKAHKAYYTSTKNSNVDIVSADMVNAVYTSIKILSENLSRLELTVTKNTAKLGQRDYVQHRLYDLLKYSPNSYQNIETFLQVVVTHLYMQGNTFAWIGEGQKSLDIVEYGYFTEATIKNGRLWYFSDSADKVYPADRLLHFKLPVNKNQFFATNPLEALRLNMNMLYKAEKTVDNHYENNAQGQFILERNEGQSNKKIDEAIDAFQDEYLGINGQGVIVPPPLTTLKQITLNVQDQAFLNTVVHNEQTIASAFGVPVYMLGHTDSKYSSYQEASLNFRHNTMAALINIIKSELEYKLLEIDERKKGVAINFDVQKLIDTDLKSKAEIDEKIRKNGGMTPNEFARKWGHKGTDSEYGDMHFIQGAEVPIEMYEKFNFSKIKDNNSDKKDKEDE